MPGGLLFATQGRRERSSVCVLALPFRPFYSNVSRLDASHIPRVIFVISCHKPCCTFSHTFN